MMDRNAVAEWRLRTPSGSWEYALKRERHTLPGALVYTMTRVLGNQALTSAISQTSGSSAPAPSTAASDQACHPREVIDECVFRL